MATYTRIGAADAAIEKILAELESTIRETTTEYLRSVSVLIDSHDRDMLPCIQLNKTIDLSKNLPKFALDVSVFVERIRARQEIEIVPGEEYYYYDNLKLIQNNIVVPTLFSNKSSDGQPISDIRTYNYKDNNLDIILYHKSTDSIRFVRGNEAVITYSFLVKVGYSAN